MDSEEVLESDSTEDAPALIRPKAAPIESRFLYVDVAAMRAKQLRRGAVPRLEEDDEDLHRVRPHKAERVAMEEVRRCLVLYDVPTSTKIPEVV